MLVIFTEEIIAAWPYFPQFHVLYASCPMSTLSQLQLGLVLLAHKPSGFNALMILLILHFMNLNHLPHLCPWQPAALLGLTRPIFTIQWHLLHIHPHHCSHQQALWHISLNLLLPTTMLLTRWRLQSKLFQRSTQLLIFWWMLPGMLSCFLLVFSLFE